MRTRKRTREKKDHRSVFLLRLFTLGKVESEQEEVRGGKGGGGSVSITNAAPASTKARGRIGRRKRNSLWGESERPKG